MEVGKPNLAAILEAGTYTVPIYQRPYSWADLQWSCLVVDVQNMFDKEIEGFNDENKPKSHFMGATVFHQMGSSKTKFSIVDGQQRILTLTLFTAALLKYISVRPLDSVPVDGSNSEDASRLFTESKKSQLRISLMRLLSNSINEFGDREDTDNNSYRIQPLNSDAESFFAVMLDAFSESAMSITKVAIDPTKKEDKKKQTPPIKLAYIFFYGALKNFFENPELLEKHGFTLMVKTFIGILKKDLLFASIVISKDESPQEIFESLNARSVSLTSFDLIKNMVLMNTNPDESQAVYSKYWKVFEDMNEEIPFWTERRTNSFEKALNVSRDTREIFLNYWLAGNLTPDERTKINKLTGEDRHDADGNLRSDDGVFWAFKTHMAGRTESKDFEEISEKICRDAKIFRDLTEACKITEGHDALADRFNYTSNSTLKDNGVLLGFVYRSIEEMERRSLWQMVFWLLKDRKSTISKSEQEKFLHVLEGFVVRQFLSMDRVKTENLNQALKNLIFKLSEAEERNAREWKSLHGDTDIEFKAGEELVKIFERSMANEAKRQEERRKKNKTASTDWVDGYVNKNFYLNYPTDKDLLSSIRTLQLHSSSDIQRVKVILEEVESKKRGYLNPLVKSKSSTDLPRCAAKKYQLEHIMPKSWKENWPILGEDPDEQKANERNRAVNLLGNFSLVLPGINNAMSNNAWEHKLEELKKHNDQGNQQVLLLRDVFTHAEKVKEHNEKNPSNQLVPWQEDHIKERSDEMIKHVIGIWPSLDSFKSKDS